MRLTFLIAAAIFLGALNIRVSLAQAETVSVGNTVTDDPPCSVTSDTAEINNHPIPYHATTGFLTLGSKLDPNAKTRLSPSAEIFYVAYTRDGCDKTHRPIAFCFNGGPPGGLCASSWLNFSIGPRRLVYSANGESTRGAWQTTNNAFSFLDQIDLVFVDPVPAGYSHTNPGVLVSSFEGYENDTDANAQFIAMYLRVNHRELSRKILIGESYGTIRIASIAHRLPSDYHINVDGLILISQALNLEEGDSNLHEVMALPTQTAIAWHYGKIALRFRSQSLETVCQAAEHYTQDEYAPALLQGDALPYDRSREIASQLAEFTGCDAQEILDAHLHMPKSSFFQSEGLVINPYDARITAPKDMAGNFVWAMVNERQTVLDGIFTSDLKFTSGHPYREVVSTQWGANRNFMRDFDILGRDMQLNPTLRVFIAAGRYDQITPYYRAIYGLDHLHIDPAARKRVQVRIYPAGHMITSDLDSLMQFKSDFNLWLQET